MTQHEIRVHRDYFDAINNEIKTFIVRKDNWTYKVGDTLKIYCSDDENNIVTVPNYKDNLQVPLRIYACITYIQTHEDCPNGIPEDYIIIGIRRTG